MKVLRARVTVAKKVIITGLKKYMKNSNKNRKGKRGPESGQGYSIYSFEGQS